MSLISGGESLSIRTGTRNKLIKPGTIAATAQFIHVISTPTAVAAKPTHSGLPAIDVRNIVQVTASV